MKTIVKNKTTGKYIKIRPKNISYDYIESRYSVEFDETKNIEEAFDFNIEMFKNLIFDITNYQKLDYKQELRNLKLQKLNEIRL